MDWRDAAQEKLKEVGQAIAQDIEVLLDGAAPESVVVALSDGTTTQLDRREAEAL